MASISDIQAECRDLCDADSNNYDDTTFLRRVNDSLLTVQGWIMQADGTWQFDDSNYTDNPVGTGTLTSGQNRYTFADELLDIEEIDILDTGGVYRRIKPFDPDELGMSFEEWTGTVNGTVPSGFPEYYDKQGDSIRLDRSPTASYVTLASGLKVRFKRKASIFTSAELTAGTKAPGFVSLHHMVLAYMTAIPYCIKYHPERVGQYRAIVGDNPPPQAASGFKAAIIAHYSERSKDERRVLTMKGVAHV